MRLFLASIGLALVATTAAQAEIVIGQYVYPDSEYGTLRQLVDACGSDPAVRSAVTEAGRVLGRALAATVGTLNPGRIAVGGLVGVLPDFLRACRQQILDDAFEPSLVDLEVVSADSRTATAVGLCKLVEESLYAPERVEQLLAQRAG